MRQNKCLLALVTHYHPPGFPRRQQFGSHRRSLTCFCSLLAKQRWLVLILMPAGARVWLKSLVCCLAGRFFVMSIAAICFDWTHNLLTTVVETLLYKYKQALSYGLKRHCIYKRGKNMYSKKHLWDTCQEQPKHTPWKGRATHDQSCTQTVSRTAVILW